MFFFPPLDTQVGKSILAFLAAISVWTAAHHLKVNPDKTELHIIPRRSSLFKDLTITVDNTGVSSSSTANNLGVTLGDLLSFSANIAAGTHSWRSLLYNIRRIWPLLTAQAAQAMSRPLLILHLDHCNSLLAEHHQTYSAESELRRSSGLPFLKIHLHYSSTPLAVVAHIKLKSLVLAFQATTRTSPCYLQLMLRPYTQS